MSLTVSPTTGTACAAGSPTPGPVHGAWPVAGTARQSVESR